MTEPPTDPHARLPWWSDRWLWSALLVAFVLRVAPMITWGMRGCTRDECSYKLLARRIVDGQGLTPHEGWLWAPGHPFLLAAFDSVGSVYDVKRLQVVLSLATLVLLYLLARRLVSVEAGRWAAFLGALHPTLAYFAGTLWSETAYAFLLVAGVAAVVWAREGTWRRALLPGALLAGCVLFRGVATYMAPLFALALVWPESERWRAAFRARWRHAVALFAALVVLVAPYSIHASIKHGGPVISDASLGQVMYVGNSDFPLTTYDLSNGVLVNRTWVLYYAKGRDRCPRALPAAQWNRCEVGRGLEWIAANPGEFVRRVPQRWAQLLNPNTFLTRHVRTGKWPGLPWWLKEAVSVWVVVTSLGVVLGGSVGAWARARGPFSALVVMIVLYHLAVIGALFGLSRFRLPLEVLWLVFLAAAIAGRPREHLRGWRAAGLALTIAILVPLCLWYLPTGFPLLWR